MNVRHAARAIVQEMEASVATHPQRVQTALDTARQEAADRRRFEVARQLFVRSNGRLSMARAQATLLGVDFARTAAVLAGAPVRQEVLETWRAVDAKTANRVGSIGASHGSLVTLVGREDVRALLAYRVRWQQLPAAFLKAYDHPAPLPGFWIVAFTAEGVVLLSGSGHDGGGR